MKAVVVRVVVPLAVLAVQGRANLARANPGGGAWLHYELTGLRAVEDTPAAPRDLVLAGARLHGIVGGRVAYHVGLDLAAGATVGDTGFAYDVALFPAGLAVRLGRTGVLALGAGVGASGATGTLDDAVALPLELTAELGGGRVRLLLRARASYVAAADARQDGAPSTSLADELDASLGIRIGKHAERFGFASGNGYFVGVSYRELGGARFAGLVLGYSIDGATPVRRDREWTCENCD